MVKRDKEIESFVAKPFWVIKTDIEIQNSSFSTVWKPKAEQDGLDEEKRLMDKNVAESLANRLAGKIRDNN